MGKQGRGHAARARLRSAVVESGLLQKGDSLLVCVSGGADSVALLHLLCFGLADYHFRLTACHLHHGLRASADGDLLFVRTLCRAWGIPLVAARADTAALSARQKKGIEAAGRTLRYAFFERTADRCGCDKIVTAHTLNDQAETVLLRLIRGSGGRGLCGIPPRRGRVVRPLLTVERREIEAYLAACHIPHREDETNHTDAYTRNRVRREILPLILRENPRFLKAASRLAAALRADESYLAAETDALKAAAKRENGYDLKTLQKADPALLRRFCLQLAGSGSGCERLMRVIEVGGRYGGFYTAGGLLLSGEPAPAVKFSVKLTQNGAVLPDGRRLKPQIEKNPCQNVHKNALFPPIDCDKIKGTLRIHSREGGERLTLLERGLTKSVKKLCQEAGIEPDLRARLLFLSDEAGTLAVERLGVTARVAVGAKTKQVLLITAEVDHDKAV